MDFDVGKKGGSIIQGDWILYQVFGSEQGGHTIQGTHYTRGPTVTVWEGKLLSVTHIARSDVAFTATSDAHHVVVDAVASQGIGVSAVALWQRVYLCFLEDIRPNSSLCNRPIRTSRTEWAMAKYISAVFPWSLECKPTEFRCLLAFPFVISHSVLTFQCSSNFSIVSRIWGNLLNMIDEREAFVFQTL